MLVLPSLFPGLFMAERIIGRVRSIEIIVGNGADIVPALSVQIDQSKYEGDQLKERKTVTKKYCSVFLPFLVAVVQVYSRLPPLLRAKLSKLKPSSPTAAFAKAIVNELHLDEQDRPQIEAAINSLKQQLATVVPAATASPSPSVPSAPVVVPFSAAPAVPVTVTPSSSSPPLASSGFPRAPFGLASLL